MLKRKPVDTATERAMSEEAVKLIRKLSWLGLEAEVQQLEKGLEHHAVANRYQSRASHFRPSIPSFFPPLLPRVNRDKRARAIKKLHCASRLAFARALDAGRLFVDAMQHQEACVCCVALLPYRQQRCSVEIYA
jgi:hypothetical protein